MRALVISGGGSKGAFAGGVAQYLLQNKYKKYDLFIGTSTGSLLIPHLALGKIDKIYNVFTEVCMTEIFNVNPFRVRNNNGIEIVKINHFNMIKQFLRRKKTFGESKRLLKYIQQCFTIAEFEELKSAQFDIVISVTNLSQNRAEYKSIHDCTYEEFCDWIWISSNYIPFMSLATRNDCDYGDGGFSSLVPIQQAIIRGATEVDVIVLETEKRTAKIAIGRNPFSLLIDLFRIELDQIEKHDILLGKLSAADNNVKLNIYYTPIELTHNALIFNKAQMKEWWKKGFDYAKNKSEP
jgi:NTE family protein